MKSRLLLLTFLFCFGILKSQDISDNQVGGIISIVELDNENNFWRSQSPTSNTIMTSSDDSGIDNVRKIKLRFEIKAKFEIK